MSGSFPVVGSFFENLVMIKMSGVGRVATACLLPGPICPDIPLPRASAQSRAERGQRRWNGGRKKSGGGGQGPAGLWGVGPGHLCRRPFEGFAASICRRSQMSMQVKLHRYSGFWEYSVFCICRMSWKEQCPTAWETL